MSEVFYKKLPCLILVAYTVLAIVGSFSLAATEPLRSVNYTIENHKSDTILGALENHFVQHPAEEPGITTKTDNTSFSPIRTGFQRIASIFGLTNTGITLSKTPFMANTKITYTGLKNVIPLKLRI
jgi:hypothetical protein